MKNLFYTYPKYIVKHLLEALHIIPREGAYDVTKDPLLKDGWPIYSIANYSMFDSHIGYGKVTERVTISQGEAYTTVYFFDTGEDTYFPEKDKNINTRYEYEEYDGGLSKVLSGEMFYNSKLHKWGKLMAVVYYNSKGTTIKEENYGYNDVKQANSSMLVCLDTIVTFTHNPSSDIAKKLLICPDYMTMKVTRDYPQGGGVSTTIVNTYSYDNKLRVNEETTKDSRGITHFTRYTYPDKMYGNTHYSSFDTLSQKGIIGRPVETITGYIQGGTECVTGGKVNIWAFNIVSENGKNIKRPYLSKTLSLALQQPLNLSEFHRLSANSRKQPVWDSHYVLDAEYKFDGMNRLISVKPFGLMETKYTWNGIYPATKTIGNQTWKYSFIPHVGVSQITDPREITTYYTYDEAGRLVEEYTRERDGYKQILNAYQYHIKTE